MPADAVEKPPFGFDPVSRSFRADPWAIYDRMRAARSGAPLAARRLGTDALPRSHRQSVHPSVGTAITPEPATRRHGAVGEPGHFLRALVRERRATPPDDLVSALIAAEVARHRLTEEEIVSNTALLLSAGYETTMGLI